MVKNYSDLSYKGGVLKIDWFSVESHDPFHHINDYFLLRVNSIEFNEWLSISEYKSVLYTFS